MKSIKLKTYFIPPPCGNDGDEIKDDGDEDNFVNATNKNAILQFVIYLILSKLS